MGDIIVGNGIVCAALRGIINPVGGYSILPGVGRQCDGFVVGDSGMCFQVGAVTPWGAKSDEACLAIVQLYERDTEMDSSLFKDSVMLATERAAYAEM